MVFPGKFISQNVIWCVNLTENCSMNHCFVWKLMWNVYEVFNYALVTIANNLLPTFWKVGDIFRDFQMTRTICWNRIQESYIFLAIILRKIFSFCVIFYLLWVRWIFMNHCNTYSRPLTENPKLEKYRVTRLLKFVLERSRFWMRDFWMVS